MRLTARRRSRRGARTLIRKSMGALSSCAATPPSLISSRIHRILRAPARDSRWDRPGESLRSAMKECDFGYEASSNPDLIGLPPARRALPHRKDRYSRGTARLAPCLTRPGAKMRACGNSQDQLTNHQQCRLLGATRNATSPSVAEFVIREMRTYRRVQPKRAPRQPQCSHAVGKGMSRNLISGPSMIRMSAPGDFSVFSGA